MENDDTGKHDMLNSPGDTRLPAPADLASIWALVYTERLVLRRPRAGDGPALFAVDGDPAATRYVLTGPDPDVTVSEARLQRWLQHWEDQGYGYWAVMLPKTEHVIGFGGVIHQVWRERDVLNLYYRFTPSAWGQGYASEVARMAIALAQAHLPPWPVIARTRAGNIASQRTAERAGLKRRPDLDTEYLILTLGWPSEDGFEN
ncbi:MAG: GNAT family N-acetyltransferase [Ktedonobacteraceae bacterium]|nr:GNAT family N-acetyltransferase [Ktedonobacteraceae bacterium]